MLGMPMWNIKEMEFCKVRTTQHLTFICDFRFVLSNQRFSNICGQSDTVSHSSGWFRFDESHTSSQRWSCLIRSIRLRNFFRFLQQLLTNYTAQRRTFLPPIPTHEVKSRHDWRKKVSVTHWYRGEESVTKKSSICCVIHYQPRTRSFLDTTYIEYIQTLFSL